jgi:hypothetical protein
MDENMANADCNPGRPTGLDAYVELLNKANGIEGVVEAVQDYLHSWTQERVARLQTMDGGWAPFDRERRPQRINSAAAIHCVHNAIHAHSNALREVNLAPTPELLELEVFFGAASYWVAQHSVFSLPRHGERARVPVLFEPDSVFAT